jgi:hypothetical protein
MPRTIISAIHGPATIVDKRTERKECRALIDQLLRAIKQAMTETHRGNLNNVAHLIKKIFRYEYFTVHPKRLFFLRKSTIMEQMLELCFKLNEEDTLLEWRQSREPCRQQGALGELGMVEANCRRAPSMGFRSRRF